MLSSEAIDPPKNFTGIQGTIEAVRGIRRSEEEARAVIAVSIPISSDNKELVTEIMQMIKMPVFLGFGFMQGALDFLDDQTDPNAGQPPAPTTTPMSVNGQDAQPVKRATRRKPGEDARDIIPHKFSDNLDNPGYCLYCKLGQMHAVHQPQPATDDAAADDGEAPSELAEKLLADIEADADAPPLAAEDLTDEQREARARLAHEAHQP